jgi:hypothetical protein
MVAKRLAQVEEGLPQVVTGDLLGAIGPQQANQGLSPVWTVRFHRQISQKRTNLVRFQHRNRHIVYHDLQRTTRPATGAMGLSYALVWRTLMLIGNYTTKMGNIPDVTLTVA